MKHLLIGLLFLPLITQAQTIERQVISAYGFSNSTDSIHISATAGETVVSKIYKEENGSASQGFQQGSEESGSLKEEMYTGKLIIFPNPVDKHLKIKYYSELADAVELRLYNMVGESLVVIPLKVNINSFTHQEINVSEIPAGVYFLSVLTADNRSLESHRIAIIH